MNISDIPCIDFFARKQASIAMEPRFWLHCINACQQAGYTLDEVRCKVEDISFIYSEKLSIMDEHGSFNQAMEEYAKMEEKLPDCREYAKAIGLDIDTPCACLCKVCPVSGKTASVSQEYAILAKIFMIPEEEGIGYLNGGLEFNSYVDMDSGDVFSGTMFFPFVLPIASIIYKCLCAEPGKFYHGIRTALQAGTARALMQSAEIKTVVEEVYKIVITAADEMVNDPFGGHMDIDCVRETLLHYICNNVFMTAPASDMLFSVYTSGMDGEEDEEGENAEPPAFGTMLKPDPVFNSKNYGTSVGGEEADIGCHVAKAGIIEENAVKKKPETGKSSHTNTVFAGELKNDPLSEKAVSRTKGTWFGKQDMLMTIPYQSRRYKIPFAENERTSLSASRNVIMHHEIQSGALEIMMDISAQSTVEEEKRRQEIRFLTDKIRKDFSAAVEIAYVTDLEMYVMLIWNPGSRRFDYIPLIDKEHGQLKEIPYPIIQFLRSEKRRIICYQPYLLCGMCSLYDRTIEIKTVYSIYSQFRVLARESSARGEGWGSCMMEDIFESYFYSFDERELFKKDLFCERYGKDAFFLAMMPLYRCICEKQIRQAKDLGITGLCISQAHKDLMYGYSYLGCGIYPSRQQAAFSMYSNGHIEFLCPVEPSISYVPGYIMKYSFLHKDQINGGTMNREIYSNRRVGKLLLKDLAGLQPAFYHNDLKVLYMDDFGMVFFAAYKYRAIHATDIGQILMHETYRHKISSNELKAEFWATSLTEVRYIGKH